MSILVLYHLLMALTDISGQQLSVYRRISEYGQSLILHCEIDKCCDLNKSIGWEIWDPNFRILYIDVQKIPFNRTIKYAATPIDDGYLFIIRNFKPQEDLNKGYSCSYKFSRSDKLFLHENDIFLDVNSTRLCGESNTTAAGGIIDDGCTNECVIMHIIFVTVELLIIIIGTVLLVWKTRKWGFQGIQIPVHVEEETTDMAHGDLEEMELLCDVKIFENLQSKYSATQCWQKILIKLLKDYEYDEAEGRKLIQFLKGILRFAILAVKKQSSGEVEVQILHNLAPRHIDLISWRTLLHQMDFNLNQPTENIAIDSITVWTSSEIKVQSLKESIELLLLMKVCNWQILQTILDMKPGYPETLLETLEHCREFKTLESLGENTIAKLNELYELDTFSMRQIGFYREHETKSLSWRMPELTSNLIIVTSILHGLYGLPPVEQELPTLPEHLNL